MKIKHFPHQCMLLTLSFLAICGTPDLIKAQQNQSLKSIPNKAIKKQSSDVKKSYSLPKKSKSVVSRKGAKVSEITEDKLITLEGNIKNISIEKTDASTYKLLALVNFKLINNGREPVLFLKEIRESETPVYVGSEISAPGAERLVDDYFGESYNKKSPYWQEQKRNLDTPAPPSEQINILFPGQPMEFERTVEIHLPNDKSKTSYYPTRASLEDLKNISDVNLRVTYQTWTGNLDMAEENGKLWSFGKELQKRWKDYGHLYLKNIISEPMQLDLGSLDTVAAKK